MLPQQHIILGILLIAIIKLVRPKTSWTLLIAIFTSSVLIDLDHYLVYIFWGNGFNVMSAYNWFMERNALGIESGIHIFHTIEFYLLILLGLYFTNKGGIKSRKWKIVRDIFLGVAIGVLFHIAIDHLTIMIGGGHREYSIIYWLLTK